MIYIYISTYIIQCGVTKLQMEIENIAIFDGYVLDTFSCDLFHRVNCQTWKTTRFLKEKHPIKNRKSFRYTPYQKTQTRKNIFNKNHVRHVYCSLLGVCVGTPAEKKSPKEAQLGASPPQQSLWMFWLDLRQFDLEEMGWLLNYLTSVGANARKRVAGRR